MSFSDKTISSFESLILECSLENARQQQSNTSDHDSPAHEMSQKDLEQLCSLPGNMSCMDCYSEDTEWASISFGIFLCAECSGFHRALGTHISRVRSVKMDSWTKDQLCMMRHSGNQQCRQFLEQQGVDFAASSIRERYSSAPASLYHKDLKARVENIMANEEEEEEESPPTLAESSASSLNEDVPASDSDSDLLADDSVQEHVATPTQQATVSDLARAVQRRTVPPRSSDYLLEDASMKDRSMKDSSMGGRSFRDGSMRDYSMRENLMTDDSSRRSQYVQNFRDRFVNGRGVARSTSASSDGFAAGRGVERTRSASSATSYGRQGLFGARRASLGPPATKLTRSVSASAPTVTYLGRSFRADTFVSRGPSRRSSMDSSVRSDNERNTETDSEFAKLKASLKDAGAMTTMSVKLKLQGFSNYNSNNISIAPTPLASSTKDKAPKPPRRPSRRASWLGSASGGEDKEDEYQKTIVISPIA